MLGSAIAGIADSVERPGARRWSASARLLPPELTEEQVVARRLGTVRAMERWVASAEGVEAPTEGDHALIVDNSSISMRARAAATAVPPPGLRARTPPDCNTVPLRFDLMISPWFGKACGKL
jgi:hypothetical protein